MRTPLLLAAFVFACVGRVAAEVPSDDGVLARQALAIEVRQLLLDGKFSELDRRAKTYAESKETFADGWWKLSVFFSGLDGPQAKADDRTWQTHLAAIERWVAASKSDATAATVQGKAYASYAWAARGGGYADTVTEQGWKLFAERLAKARKILNSVHERRDSTQKQSIGWYSAMLSVALGEGWARKEYDALYNAAVAAHPDYYEFHLKKAHYLLPRWFGEPGEWQRFARAVRKTAGPDVFARICWANGQTEGLTEMFTAGGITWQEIDAGFTQLMKKNPRSAWTLNYYCRMACAARQREAARQLFKEIGDDVYIEAWQTEAYYKRIRAWALDARPAAR
jgi:hypothetical protein